MNLCSSMQVHPQTRSRVPFTGTNNKTNSTIVNQLTQLQHEHLQLQQKLAALEARRPLPMAQQLQRTIKPYTRSMSSSTRFLREKTATEHVQMAAKLLSNNFGAITHREDFIDAVEHIITAPVVRAMVVERLRARLQAKTDAVAEWKETHGVADTPYRQLYNIMEKFLPIPHHLTQSIWNLKGLLAKFDPQETPNGVDLDPEKLFASLIVINHLDMTKPIECCISADARPIWKGGIRPNQTVVGFKNIWSQEKCQDPREMWKQTIYDGNDYRIPFQKNTQRLRQWMLKVIANNHKMTLPNGQVVSLFFTCVADMVTLWSIFGDLWCFFCDITAENHSKTCNHNQQSWKMIDPDAIPAEALLPVQRKHIKICLLHAKKRAFSTLLTRLLQSLATNKAQTERNKLPSKLLQWNKWCHANGFGKGYRVTEKDLSSVSVAVPNGQVCRNLMAGGWKQLLAIIEEQKNLEKTIAVWSAAVQFFELACKPSVEDAKTHLQKLETVAGQFDTAFRARYMEHDITHYLHWIFKHSFEQQQECIAGGRTLWWYQQEGWEAMNNLDKFILLRGHRGANVGRKRKRTQQLPEEEESNPIDDSAEAQLEEVLSSIDAIEAEAIQADIKTFQQKTKKVLEAFAEEAGLAYSGLNKPDLIAMLALDCSQQRELIKNQEIRKNDSTAWNRFLHTDCKCILFRKQQYLLESMRSK